MKTLSWPLLAVLGACAPYIDQNAGEAEDAAPRVVVSVVDDSCMGGCKNGRPVTPQPPRVTP